MKSYYIEGLYYQKELISLSVNSVLEDINQQSFFGKIKLSDNGLIKGKLSDGALNKPLNANKITGKIIEYQSYTKLFFTKEEINVLKDDLETIYFKLFKKNPGLTGDYQGLWSINEETLDTKTIDHIFYTQLTIKEWQTLADELNKKQTQ